MSESYELNELYAALAKAQADMKVTELDSRNPFYKSKYAKLANIIHTTRPSLTTHGLAVIQRVLHCEGKMELCTRLCHASGQWIESRMPLKPNDAKIQSLGACITYAKRYSYTAICGVICSDDIEEDDDGNGDKIICEREEKKLQATVTEKNAIDNEKVTDDDITLLSFLIGDDEEYQERIKKWILRKCNIKDYSELTKEQFNWLCARLRKREKENAMKEMRNQ